MCFYLKKAKTMQLFIKAEIYAQILADKTATFQHPSHFK